MNMWRGLCKRGACSRGQDEDLFREDQLGGDQRPS